MNNYRQRVQFFTRICSLNVITGANGTGSTFAAYTFKITDLPKYDEFTKLYDAYKIKAVKISFIPPSNVTSYQSTADFNQSAFTSRIYTVIDTNDATVPTSIDDLREYKLCKWSPNTRIHKRFIYPKSLVAINEGNNVYGVSNMGSPWIATANNQTQFFGIKVGISHPTFTQDTQLYHVEAKYYLAFKNVK